MTDASRPATVPWPPIVSFAAMALSIAMMVVYPLPWFGSPLADILVAFGWLALAGAVSLYVSALRAFHRAGTTVSPVRGATHLITGGAFGISRNPLYLANAVLMFGVGLIVGSVWFFALGFLAAYATAKLAIEPEEKHLRAKFGKKYLDYCKRVRRWV